MAKAEYRSSLRSKKLIMDAFMRLLGEKPLEKITVTDIVKQADINRGTFYAHYANVSDLVSSMFQNAFEVFKVTLTKESPFSGHPCVHMLNKLQELIEQDLEFYRKVYCSDVNMKIYEQIGEILVSYILEHEEELSDIPHEDFLFYTSFFSGGLMKLYRDWFLGTLPISLDELTKRAVVLLDELQTKLRHETLIQ